MQKTCANSWCKQTFEITEEDLAVLQKLSPRIAGQTFNLPEPVHCFRCRLQRRAAFYNARSLYRGSCALTGKPMISVYSPEKKFTVYDKDEWQKDSWDPLAFGRDVDFSRPFSDQVRQLLEVVPMFSISHFGWQNINSDYSNDNYKVKNCYLTFDGEQGEDCYYLHSFLYVKNCVDNVNIMRSELCYECVHCQDSYDLRYSRYCTNCSESWFLRDCIGCKHCFGCANLRQKEYCIWNEQKTKKEYEDFLAEFRPSSHEAVSVMRRTAEEHFLKFPVKASRGEQTVNSLGDNLNRSKNAYWCFDCNDQEDSRYSTNCMMSGKDLCDIHVWGDGIEMCYDCSVIGADSRELYFCHNVSQGSSNILYSFFCMHSCLSLLGCVGLRRKKYCILNKQYTEEEYNELAPKVIQKMIDDGEWGTFFPYSVSMFGYNETMAQTFFPLTKKEAKDRGWQWCDYESAVDATKSIRADQLPDDLDDVSDDVLQWAITCEVTGKPFKIIKQELDFYRTQRLPIPRRHPDQRHVDRYSFKNPYQLWDRSCAKCNQAISTSYSPERPEIVYCESCYLATVY